VGLSLLQVNDVSIELRARDGTSRAIFPRVTFALEVGETLAIVGDSGSGKTSLLNVIAGFIRPANHRHVPAEASRARMDFLPSEQGGGKASPFVSGQVRIQGEDVTTLPPEKRNVGMLMQSFSVFEDRTVLDNLTFKKLIEGVSEKDRRKIAREVFDQLGFSRGPDEVLTSEASRLSGGEKQRVALGRLIIERPMIWLLDEPYANLDAIRRDRISRDVHARLSGLVAQDVPVCALIVCHDLAETHHARKMLVLAADHAAPQWALCERQGAKFTLLGHGPDPSLPPPLKKWLDRLTLDGILE
jgi:putative spermidine/putrescine transport system ATP-binding protein